MWELQVHLIYKEISLIHIRLSNCICVYRFAVLRVPSTCVYRKEHSVRNKIRIAKLRILGLNIFQS